VLTVPLPSKSKSCVPRTSKRRLLFLGVRFLSGLRRHFRIGRRHLRITSMGLACHGPEPGKPGDEFEDDFLLLSDVFPTGYHSTEQANVLPGDTVAIWGAGPVGLMAGLSAKIRGASEIYIVDCVDDRLQKASELRATPIDFRKGDPVQQIFDLREPHGRNVQELRESSGRKMPGVMCGIDAVGYEAWATDSPGKDQEPTQVIEDLIRVTNPSGHIGLIGVYFPEDPGGVDKEAQKGRFTLSLGLA
jgi:glutathione-independent formaldehyde dehydrogenase